MPKKSSAKPVDAVVVTDEQPRDPRWDAVRKTTDELRLCGRMFLRGQVRLGMQLAALKKEYGIRPGQPKKNSPESGKFEPWAAIVKRESGYSRQSADVFIGLFEASKKKLKTAKKLDLPAPAKKDAIALFQSETALTLTAEQWQQVDAVIGTLTDGETQASLMQELGVVPKPKPMPKGGKKEKEEEEDEEEEEEEVTAGQLAFHFFETIAAPLINARTNPKYKKLLLALPIVSDADHPLSLATLEAEFRAALADIEDAKQAAAKPARGRAIR